MLSLLSAYIPEIPRVEVDGIFGPATREAVLAAQRWFGLPQTGSVDAATWDEIYDQFSGIETTSLRDGERFPQIQQQAVAAFAANPGNNRTRYNRTSTLTQFPGMDLRTGQQDSVRQEVIR